MKSREIILLVNFMNKSFIILFTIMNPMKELKNKYGSLIKSHKKWDPYKIARFKLNAGPPGRHWIFGSGFRNIPHKK